MVLKHKQHEPSTICAKSSPLSPYNSCCFSCKVILRPVLPFKGLVAQPSLETELTCKCDCFFLLISLSLLSKWNAVVQDLRAAMEQVFHPCTVEEWMEENVHPSLQKLQQVVDDLDKAIKAQN